VVVDNLPKAEAKQAVLSFLFTTHPTSDLVLFTDGSAHHVEGLGAPAITLDTFHKQLAFLWPLETASNFECKLVGIRLGLELGKVLQAKRHFHRFIILSNSQAAINQIRSPGRPSSGQYLLTQIQEKLGAIPPHTELIL
jgi:ribonuclease HI